jgi:hypothetical protein
MRILVVVLIVIAVLSATPSAHTADLAASLCQDEYKVSDEKLCQGLLIGTIDSLFGIGEYCPDGATSYRHIIDTWRRLLRREPNLKSQATVVTVRRAISDLGLLCRK